MSNKHQTNLVALIKVLRSRSGAGVLDCRRALVASNYDLSAAWTWLRTQGKTIVAQKQARATNAGGVFSAVGTAAAVVFELKSETDFVVRNQQFLTLARNIATAFTTSSVDFGTGGTAWVDCPVPTGGQVKDLIADQIQVIGENIVLGRVLRVKKTSDISFGMYNHFNHRLAAFCVFRGTEIDRNLGNDVAMHVATVKPDYLRWSDIDDATLVRERAIITRQLEQDPAVKSKPRSIVARIIEGRIKKVLGSRVLYNQSFILRQTQTVEEWLQQHDLEIIQFMRLSVDES